ncbi:MAG: hypothetical protein ACKOFW_07100, partial [Planctomycetaceae bacterium]
MATPPPRSVLLLGDVHADEFGPVIALLRGAVSHRRLWECDRFADFATRVAGRSQRIELVVVCQGWSDQFPRSQVHNLLSTLPMARFVCCHGAWCESDGRNRDLWPLAVRLPVGEATRWLADLLAEWAREDRTHSETIPCADAAPSSVPLSSGEANYELDTRAATCDAWTPTSRVANQRRRPEAFRSWLPLTASRSEIFAQRFPPVRCLAGGCGPEAGHAAVGWELPSAGTASATNPHSAAVRLGGRVFVDSPDRTLSEMLARSFQSQGWQSISSAQGQPDLLVFDADPWGLERQQRLKELRQSASQAVVACLTGMPGATGEGLPRESERLLRWDKLAP